MPGSGKSTLGKQLSPVLALEFIDLDQEIELREGKSIPDIFIEKGEDHFRQIESSVLTEYSSSSKSFVMATGGGAPCFFKGMETINRTGISVFLDVEVRQLLLRTKGKTNRPLLDQSEADREHTLTRLFETRLPCYRQARIIIKDPNVNKVLEAIHFRK